MGYIVDLSHHQDPAKIDYDTFAKHLDHAIIRTQYGSKTIDNHYKTHHRELRKRGVPTAAYAWVRGVSENDMRIEARDFWNRTKDIEPTFWWLDVEEKSMNNMRSGVKAYVQELRKLGAKKVGVYIAHHLYKTFNLDLSDFDAVWIPRYGTNDGKPQKKPDYPCDLWQYTSKGRLPGYAGDLDLNMIISDKPLSFFTGVTNASAKSENGMKEWQKKEAEEALRELCRENIIAYADNPDYWIKKLNDGTILQEMAWQLPIALNRINRKINQKSAKL